MNKQWVTFQLQEAKEELDRTIEEINSDSDYNSGEFSVAMEHLYSHLNTAWNSQNVTDEQTASHTDEDYNNWRQFPKDIKM